MVAGIGTLWKQGCRCRHPANGRNVRKARFDTVRKPSAGAHDLSYKSSVLYCSAHTKDWAVGCPPFGAVAAAQGRFTVRTSARGMSRAVFSPPQGESANRTYKGSGTLNTVSLPAAQRDCKSSAAKIKSTNTERKPNHMLTKHFNQTIVVHILRDMFLYPTCRKEESVCRTRS